MKRLAKIALGVVAAVGALALWVEVDGIPRYEAHPPDLYVQPTEARVARGKHLATIMCSGCHLDPATGAFTGKHVVDIPSAFGDVYAKNVTKSRTHGVGAWTDGELVYVLRTGIRPDGQYLPPWMPKFPNLSDEDIASLVAFLRSDDPWVAAHDTPPAGTTKPTFLAKALTHTLMKPLPYPDRAIPTPNRDDRVAYGRYLVFSYDCYGCHSASFESVDVLAPEKSKGYMGGGNTVVGAEGNPIHPANLTPDDETGIGRWSEEDFRRAVKKGFRPDGRVLRYPMMPTPELTDDETSAIWAYLRTVPKIRNEVERPAAPAASGDHPGKAAYAKYGCGSCHGESGVGPVGDLRLANEHFRDDAALRAWIDDAPSQKPGTKMPAWRGVIAEDDYPALLAYVRWLARWRPS